MPIRKTISRTRKRLKEGMDEAKEKFEEIEDSSVKYIKKNPVKSVLIAAGVGAVIGAGIAAVISVLRPRRSFWERYNPFN